MESLVKLNNNLSTKGFYVIKKFLNSSDIQPAFLNNIQKKEKFVDGVIHGLDQKYYNSIIKKIKKI